MATQKQFVDGSPVPVTPKSKDEKVQDLTPGQTISSKDQDYDEDEHSDDVASINKETEPEEKKSKKANI